jgi:hypothetical protein
MQTTQGDGKDDRTAATGGERRLSPGRPELQKLHEPVLEADAARVVPEPALGLKFFGVGWSAQERVEEALHPT